MALPKAHGETEPAFAHYASTALPMVEDDGKRVRLIAGKLYGTRSPVHVFSEMFYADAVLAPGARIELPAEHEERALYVAEGRIGIAEDRFDAGQLVVFRPGAPVTIAADSSARVLLFGGEPMDGPRHLWWNFVSSSKERIAQAKEDWRAGRFGRVPGETEFIPLPERPAPVRYP